MEIKRTIFQQIRGALGHRLRRRVCRHQTTRQRLHLGLLFTLCLNAHQTQASSETETRVPREHAGSGTSRMDLLQTDFKKPRPTRVDAFVRAESLVYPTQSPGQENLDHNNMIEAGLKLATTSDSYPSLSFSSDVAAGRSLNLNYSYVAVNELSFGWSSAKETAAVIVGRHIGEWNDADETWNLGLWQPTLAVDALRIRQQGLVGLHARINGEFVQTHVYYSPLFVPTLTPDIADRNGEITSESRWFRSIPTTSEVIGKPTQLYFRLEIPELRELVSQHAFGGQIRAGRIDSGAWARVAVADKPMNAMFFKYDAILRARSAGSRGEVELRPVVHRHQVASADVGFKYQSGEVVLSYLEEQVRLAAVENEINREGLPTDFIQQTPKPLRVGSARWDQSLIMPWLGRELRGRVAYLKADVEQTRDLDRRGVEQSALLPHRLNYTDALSLEGKTLLSRGWTFSLKYLRDFEQRGSQWSAEFEYRSRSNWLAYVGADTLGVDEAATNNTDTRFLNYYRQNDRVYGGLSYVF